MAAGQVGIHYGIRGPTLCTATACAAGAHSIGDAARLIQYGDADVMIAGGSEACISPISLTGFHRARALATSFNDEPHEASRPFDSKREGFVVSEGAGIVVLEELEHARRRGAKIYAEILGYGLTGDGHHVTAPREDGKGVIACMSRAMEDGGVGKGDIGYINAHATSTPLGDAAEAVAIRNLFQQNCDDIWVSSTKGSLGHLLGAAGAVEAIFTMLSCYSGIIPPNVNLEDPDVIRGVRLVPIRSVDWIDTDKKVALCNSFGFGGTNACLCIGEYVDPLRILGCSIQICVFDVDSEHGFFSGPGTCPAWHIGPPPPVLIDASVLLADPQCRDFPNGSVKFQTCFILAESHFNLKEWKRAEELYRKTIQLRKFAGKLKKSSSATAVKQEDAASNAPTSTTASSRTSLVRAGLPVPSRNQGQIASRQGKKTSTLPPPANPALPVASGMKQGSQNNLSASTTTVTTTTSSSTAVTGNASTAAKPIVSGALRVHVPSDVELKFRMHLCLVEMKDIGGAMQLLSSISLRFRTPKHNMALGKLYKECGSDRSAICSFKEVLKVSPRSLDAARELLLLGTKLSEILSLVIRGLPADPSLGVEWIGQWLTGLSHLASPSTVAEAVASLDAIKPPFKTSSTLIMVTLATAMYRQGSLVDAVLLLERIQKAMTYTNKVPEVWTIKGLILMEIGKFPEAIDCFKQALILWPKFFPAHLYMVQCHQSLMLPQTVVMGLHAFKQMGNCPEGLTLYASVLKRQVGSLVKATKLLDRALSLNPGYVNAAIYLAMVYREVS
ncbi:unnamed protein product [Cyprideis torosa]|nr:unnamed protein product [Cyprideis torosa]CAG0883295.1 unnamed protein product [Cyprideis torosa]